MRCLKRAHLPPPTPAARLRQDALPLGCRLPAFPAQPVARLHGGIGAWTRPVCLSPGYQSPRAQTDPVEREQHYGPSRLRIGLDVAARSPAISTNAGIEVQP